MRVILIEPRRQSKTLKKVILQLIIVNKIIITIILKINLHR